MIKLSNFNGNAHVGVYCVANENLAFVPTAAPESFVEDIQEALEVEVRKVTVSGSNILGSLMSMNSHGIIVTNMASERELNIIGEHVSVRMIGDKLNASGNNILVNDHAALVNPEIGRAALKDLEDIFQVEVEQGRLAGLKTVGSAAVATNEGLLCHPQTTEEELEDLSSLFGVPASIGTLNYGTPLVGACMVGNTKGAAVGMQSTPIELGRVEDSLGYI